MKENGLGLVELLVVIAIIAVVSVAVSFNFISFKSKAEKTKMQADIDAIAKSYETHFDPITQLYRPLRAGDFTNPGILTSPNYSGFLTSQSATFQVCANLEGKGAPCTSTGPNCYCRKSSQSIASAPKKSTPTPSPATYMTPYTSPPYTSPSTQPAGGGTYQVKVWLISYYPTGGFFNVVGDDPAVYTRNVLLPAMNEASKYRGYKNPSAIPALDYTLSDVDIKVENNPPPASYEELFTKYNLCNLAKQNDIKAIMIWQDGSGPYSSTGMKWESAITGNKGIPTNGANLSTCPEKTIVVYGFNYTRGLPEALESYGHHLERVFGQFRPEYGSWSDISAPRNTNLWGQGDSCGSDHNPPNARCEYDRGNPTGWRPDHCGTTSSPGSVQSDCRNFKPDGSGVKETMICDWWGCSGDGWLKWWMQNMPGIGNTLVGSNGQRIPNWWVYIGDPDNCYNNALGCSGL